MVKNKKIYKLLVTLKNSDEELSLSDVCGDLTVGDLKEIIVSAMTKQYDMLENDDIHNNSHTHKLEQWQIDDVKRHYYKEWLNFLLLNNE